MQFELIFVRHGESCANVLLKENSILKKLAHKLYTDPELSTRGRLLSERKAALFTDYLQNPRGKQEDILTPFAKGQFTLGASELFRAQETAYLMVGQHWNFQGENNSATRQHLENKTKQVFVFPFLGERGFAQKILSDNTPLEKPAQKKLFQERYPQTDVNYILPDEKDARAGPPNFQNFLEWIPNHLDYFHKGEDGVYRAVIVSHSNSLKDAFPFKKCVNAPTHLPHDDKLDNNDFLVTHFTLDPTLELGTPRNSTKPLLSNESEPPQFLIPEAEYPKWYYFDTRKENKEVTSKCGKNEMCRKNVIIKSLCSTKGGKRKTQRRRRAKPRRLSKKV